MTRITTGNLIPLVVLPVKFTRSRFASFYETAAADRTLQYLVAFLVLLSTVKLWHLFRVNPKVNVFTATLARAWSDVSSFLLIVGLLLVAYAAAVSEDVGAEGSRSVWFGCK